MGSRAWLPGEAYPSAGADIAHLTEKGVSAGSSCGTLDGYLAIWQPTVFVLVAGRVAVWARIRDCGGGAAGDFGYPVTIDEVLGARATATLQQLRKTHGV
jgi:hypothetical protein